MNPDFISVYDNALTHEECLSVIGYMESGEMLPSFLAGRYQPERRIVFRFLSKVYMIII